MFRMAINDLMTTKCIIVKNMKSITAITLKFTEVPNDQTTTGSMMETNEPLTVTALFLRC